MTVAVETRPTTSAPFGTFVRWVVLSSIGSGLIYPYTALYLVTRTSIGTGGSAAYFAVVAAFDFTASLALGTVKTRIPPGLLAGVGYLVLAVAYSLLGVVHGLVPILLIAVAAGAGRGASSSGGSPFTAQLVPEEERRDAFARRYRAMNLGLGIGLLAASLLLTVLPPSVMPALFVANGFSFVPIAWFMIRHRGTAVGGKKETPTESGGLSFGRLLRWVGLICVVQFGVFALGYSQLDATVPLVATRLSHTSLGFVSVIVVFNTVGVIVLQKPITRWLKRWSPRRGMQVAVAFWLCCYAVAGATSLLPGPFEWAGLIVLAVLFACGEASYASSSQPWLLSSVPTEEHTRASSLSNAASGVGTSLGPSLGVLLVATGQTLVVWGSLAAGCAVVVLLVQCAKIRSEGEDG